MEELHESALKALQQTNLEDIVEMSTITADGTIAVPDYVEEFYHCCAANYRVSATRQTLLNLEERCPFCRCEANLNELQKAVFANDRSLLLRFVNSVMRALTRRQCDGATMNNIRQRLEIIRASYFVSSK